MRNHILFLLCFIIFSCEKDDIHCPPAECDQELIINGDLYDNAPNSSLTIESVELKENCMTINFYSSGCSGSTWEYKLIAEDYTIPGDIPQRFIRLSLKNEELCEAIIRKEVSFDISEALGQSHIIRLSLENNGTHYIYQPGN
ncbi:hypothetical protein [Marinigracilibium pacificum]|uniref:Uncharacterized protein n=1 Tax=Marinigracilibium pacificum TaxID=2729599 RepID=A0A848IWX9_9BACT|nr:hypothetical protein [Marinigracilibium pacificum]NMM47785.1 hypothetical protein [Marinigracilibium pacificum]